MYFIGIEIGGTKLQLGIGAGDGVLAALWRETVDVAAGPEGIRRQIVAAVPELLQRSGIERAQLKGVGIGFGGPVDDATHTVIKSHQIEGWDDFPLADWVSDLVGLPAALGNDADIAGLAEALFGAGKGLSPVFYITIGSGIGGGLIINGEIYRGVGRGAAEIGHLRMHEWKPPDRHRIGPLESFSSGWGITEQVQRDLREGIRHTLPDNSPSRLDLLYDRSPDLITTSAIAEAAAAGDSYAEDILDDALWELAEAICHVIALLCPRRIVIGGGVALMGEKLLFEPLRRLVAERVFRPFAGLTDIVPAALGEEVVVHGALALARRHFQK
jgi:glucokinase